MSKRDWVRYGALVVGIIAVFAILGGSLFYNYQQYQVGQRREAARYDPTTAQQQSYDPCHAAGFVDRFNCVLREVKTVRDDKHTEYDLEAQQDMALWAFGMLILSGLSLVIGTFGVLFVAWTLRETRKMVEEAAKTNLLTEKHTARELRAYISVRPYGVKLKKVTGGKPPKGEKGDAIPIVLIRNVGNVPAQNLSWFIGHDLCTKWDKQDFPAGGDLEGDVSLPPSVDMPLGGDDFPVMNDTFKCPPDATDKYLYVFGLVQYRDGFDDEFRTTRFVHRYNCISHQKYAEKDPDRVLIPAGEGRIHRYGNKAT